MKNSIGVQFLLISTLVFDQIGMIFAVLRILLFEEWMNPTPVLPVTVGMVHLYLTIRDKALGQIRDALRYPHIDIKRIDAVTDALPPFRKAQRITLDLVRWPHKQPQVF